MPAYVRWKGLVYQMKCKQCGKELPERCGTDICLECSRENEIGRAHV